MFETKGQRERYDYIIASHVIEHVPDLLRFLNDCELLLKQQGRLALAIPDKRYCFDFFQSVSTTGDVLTAARYRENSPQPGAAFDFFANFATVNGRDAWERGTRGRIELRNPLSVAYERFNEIADARCSADIHAWRFVPSSFRLILRDLRELGLTDLREHRFAGTHGCEFYVTLAKSGPGCPLDRVELLKNALREQEER